METERYTAARARWPSTGRHILAQTDGANIAVYQAYNHTIADAAVEAQHLTGGGFRLDRMSWIKSNFLWMMHRSGWATKPDQERVLAIWIPIPAFLGLLSEAVPSSFGGPPYADEGTWRTALASSEVRLQWDPDHAPNGAPQARRAIQLGLRGVALRRFAQEWPVRIVDITPFVARQRDIKGTDALVVPVEQVLAVPEATRTRIGVQPS